MMERPKDTTTYIWDYYFKVRIPYLQSRSPSDIRTHGTVVSGVPDIDNDISNQWVTTMMPISQMIDYYKEGVGVKVVSYSDIKLIYQYISDHILAWKSRLERGINIGDAPIDDLIAMDQFANITYDHAKYQFTPELIDSILAQHMNDTQRINAHNFFNRSPLDNLNRDITRVNASDEDHYPDRDSLSDFFKTRLINLRRY